MMCVSKGLWFHAGPTRHHTKNSRHSLRKKLQHSGNAHQPAGGIWWPNDRDKLGQQNTYGERIKIGLYDINAIFLRI